ncbi:MAG: hypothetical protein QM703_16100 [Gemmatales bacterium]
MLAASFLAILVFPALQSSSPEIDYGRKSIGRYIESSKVFERKMTYNYALNIIIGNRRQKMKPYLVHVVKQGEPPQYGVITNEEEEFSSRRVALSILAEWHDPSLIPLFLEFIIYPALDPNRPSTTDAKGREPCEDYFAAVKGLINIGHSALDPTLRELIKSDIPDEKNESLAPYTRASIRHRYNNLICVIWCILGYQGAKDYFIKEIEQLKSTDPKAAEKLNQALKYLEENYRTKWNG